MLAKFHFLGRNWRVSADCSTICSLTGVCHGQRGRPPLWSGSSRSSHLHRGLKWSISALPWETNVALLPIMCVVSVSAIPAEGIPPDQTHQCRDFLLQGSTVQQAGGVCRGRDLLPVRKTGDFPSLLSETAPHALLAPGESAGGAVHAFQVHDGGPVNVHPRIRWGPAGPFRGKRGVYRELQGKSEALPSRAVGLYFYFCCSSERPCLEGHQSEEPLFRDSRRSKESRRKCVTEAEGKIPPRNQIKK